MGRALDVASGPGRNAAFLARRGFIVDAVDNSREGLRMADRLMRGALGGGDIRDRVNLIQADLTEYVVKSCRYDLVINFYYLDRGLLTGLIAGLKEGGYLVFETFTKNHLGYNSQEQSRPLSRRKRASRPVPGHARCVLPGGDRCRESTGEGGWPS